MEFTLLTSLSESQRFATLQRFSFPLARCLSRRHLDDFRRGQGRYLMSRQKADNANRPVFVLSARTIARRR